MNKFVSWLRKSYIFIILAIIYIPLILIVFMSFTNPSEKGNINLGFDWNGGENYIALFQNSEFLNALANTAIILIFTVPISTIIATLACFGIWNARQFYTNAVMGTSKFNVAIPEIISGIALALLFSITFVAAGINLGFVTIILAHISFCTPYAIMIIYPRMQKMPKNLILASIDLGYTRFQTFFKVTVPYLMPAILSGAAIVFAMSFDDFIITKLVGGRVSTISTEMYSMAKGIKAWAVTFGAIVVMIGFIVTGVIAIVKFSKLNKEKRIRNKKQFSIWLKQ